MKPFTDFYMTTMGSYLSNTLMFNSMIKYWGTHTVDGIEVLNEKFYLYPADKESINYRKIVTMFNMASSLKGANFGDVDNYYLYLNANKATDEAYTTTTLASKINLLMVIGTKYKSSISLTDSLDPLKFANYTKEQMIQYVDTNYSTLVDHVVTGSGADVLSDTLGTYVLFDDGEHLDVSITNIQMTPIPTTVITNVDGYTLETIKYITSILFEVEYSMRSNVTTSSKLVQAIVTETNEYNTRKIAELNATDSNYSMSIGRGLRTKTSEALTNDYWYKGLLRVDNVKNGTLKKKHFSKILANHLDSGYTLPKKEWWQVLLAPVLFIVAVFLAPWTGGGSLALYWAVVAVIFTVVSLAMNYWGDNYSAEYMGKYARISGYMSAATGIYTSITNIATQVAEQGLVNYVTQSVRTFFTTASTDAATAQTETLTSKIGNYLSENWFKVLNNTVSIGNRVANFWMEKRVKSQMKDMSSKSDYMKQQEEELAKYTDKEIDIGAEDIRTYSNPLLMNNLQFEVDYLYEPTKLNICRPSFMSGITNERSAKLGIIKEY